MLSNYPDRIAWCYGIYRNAYSEIAKQFPQIEFMEGIPHDVCEMFDLKKNNLIIIDDLMAGAAGDKLIASVFTK